MATQTRRTTARPLNLVLRPCSEAAAAYRSAVLAPGFDPAPGLALRYLGGRTLTALAYRIIYLGEWAAPEQDALDAALEAAMTDPGLNGILAQYFPGATVSASFAGSRREPGRVADRVGKRFVESFVARTAAGAGDLVTCLLLPRGAVLVERNGITSETGLGGYHGSVHTSAGIA
jgi:hypothetical protein